MDPEMQRAIASKGGKMAHQRKRAHEFTPEEARSAAAKRRLKMKLQQQQQAERTEPQGGEMSPAEAHSPEERTEEPKEESKSI